MSANARGRNDRTDRLLREFVDAALLVVLTIALPDPSLQIELDLWIALRGVFARQRRRNRLLLKSSNVPRLDEHLIAQLAQTAYQTILTHISRAPFLDLELAIWDAYRAIAKRHRERSTDRHRTD
jgi:hypothetical protein